MQGVVQPPTVPLGSRHGHRSACLQVSALEPVPTILLAELPQLWLLEEGVALYLVDSWLHPVCSTGDQQKC
jgi:hypothetical protein